MMITTPAPAAFPCLSCLTLGHMSGIDDPTLALLSVGGLCALVGLLCLLLGGCCCRSSSSSGKGYRAVGDDDDGKA